MLCVRIQQLPSPLPCLQISFVLSLPQLVLTRRSPYHVVDSLTQFELFLLEVLLKPGSPYCRVSSTVITGGTYSPVCHALTCIQVELRRIWAMQRPEKTELPARNIRLKNSREKRNSSEKIHQSCNGKIRQRSFSSHNTVEHQLSISSSRSTSSST